LVNVSLQQLPSCRRPRRIGQFSAAIKRKDAVVLKDCVLAMRGVLTCKFQSVKDECAAALARGLSRFDRHVPVKIFQLAHEALWQYLEEFERDPPLAVKRRSSWLRG